MKKKSIIKTVKKRGRGRPPKSATTSKNKSTSTVKKNSGKEKVKEIANDLLKDIPLTVDEHMNNATEMVIESSEINDKKSQSNSEWLEEQVGLLTDQVQELRKQLADKNEEFDNLLKGGNHSDSQLKDTVIRLFSEIQTNYLSMGKNPVTKQPNLVIPPLAFMNRMVLFFPFLNEIKKV